MIMTPMLAKKSAGASQLSRNASMTIRAKITAITT